MNEIVLEGCKATSLTGYLKALGIFRLVADQADPCIRGYWRAGTFVLKTKLSEVELKIFFLNEYVPSPIISPWSGRAGFLEGGQEGERKGAKIIGAIERSCGNRFNVYREVIASIKSTSVIGRLDIVREEVKALEKVDNKNRLDNGGKAKLLALKKEEKTLKDSVLQSLRAELDEAFLSWIDACYALVGSGSVPAPLIGGTGGNEGSMDFSINHADYLLNLIDLDTDLPTPLAVQLLDSSLFGKTQFYNSTSNIGFLDTLAAGGANMSSGFDGRPNGNVWDSVLTLEGAVLFASATTRRLGSTPTGASSFPFAVTTSYAGDGSTISSERARDEQWLPIWVNGARLAEVRGMLAEGRVTFGRHQATNGLDMLQALASLGMARGIASFERYGFYERRGQGSFVAKHLGSHSVPQVMQENWLIASLEKHEWLYKLRRFAQNDQASQRFQNLFRRLEDILFQLSDRILSNRNLTPTNVQTVLALLGNIQNAVAISSNARESVGPVPRLPELWVQKADDGSPAFRIAKALAGLRGVGDKPLPLQSQLFPVHHQSGQWITPKLSEGIRIHCGQKGTLVSTLQNFLIRRLQLTERLGMSDKPLSSPSGAMPSDVASFLRDDVMDVRIASLLPGLSLCHIPGDTDHNVGSGTLPAAFGLIKLTLIPDRTLRTVQINQRPLLSETEHIPLAAGMVAQLIAGNANNRATKIAWRRLRASGLAPLFPNPSMLPRLSALQADRAAAALLIPLRFGAMTQLARTLLAEPETDPITID